MQSLAKIKTSLISPVLALTLLAFTTRRMVRSAHLALSPARFTVEFDYAVSDTVDIRTRKCMLHLGYGEMG